MWERFSYYGMRGILIFYLTQHFFFSDENASGIYGSYTSLVYLLPLVGGLLADRYLGTRKAIAFGALLLVAGHGMMAYEGRDNRQFLQVAGAQYEFQVEGRGDNRETQLLVNGQAYKVEAGAEEGSLSVIGLPPGGVLPPVLAPGTYETVADRDPIGENVFYLALSLIIMGVGFLKPNISTIVGQLYPQGDPARDPGFTLYYYGINLGAFWASISAACWARRSAGGPGFGLAGVGMLLGFIVFVLNKPALEGHGEPPDPARLTQKVGPVSREWLIYGASLVGVIGVWALVRSNELVGGLLALGIIGSLAAIALILARVCKTLAERQRLMLAMVLVFGAVVFFTLFEQAGTSLNLFADRNVQLPSDGFMTMTAAQTQSFNAGFILIFAPMFAALWVRLGSPRQGSAPADQVRAGLGSGRLRLPDRGLGGGLRRRQRAAAADLPGAAVPVPHHGRAVPVAGRAVGDHQAVAAGGGVVPDGGVVPELVDRPVRGRLDRRARGHGDGRGPGAGPAGGAPQLARGVQHAGLGGDHRRRGVPWPVPAAEALEPRRARPAALHGPRRPRADRADPRRRAPGGQPGDHPRRGASRVWSAGSREAAAGSASARP
jgi:dipeptide/tripeptide permease